MIENVSYCELQRSLKESNSVTIKMSFLQYFWVWNITRPKMFMHKKVNMYMELENIHLKKKKRLQYKKYIYIIKLAYIIKLRCGHIELGWALDLVTCVLVRRGQETHSHT